MPLVPSLSGFAVEQYERVMRGLELIAPEAEERRRARLARDSLDPTIPREVNIPQWDDIIHLRPRLQVTRAERNEFFSALRDGRAPNLSPETAHEIRRRERFIDHLKRTPQPGYARGFGAVNTAMDNVQDFLASVSIFGRIAPKVGGKLLSMLVPTGTSGARLFRKRVAKLGARAVPGLGAALLAADLLNLMMFFGRLALVGFAAMCQGPRDALAAGVGTGLVKGAFKGGMALLARLDPRALRWRATRALRVARNLGTIGKILVVLQTTDELFGVGISLGPIVGGLLESVYAGERRQRGLPVRLAPKVGSDELTRRLREKARRLPTPALRDRQAAAAVLKAAPSIHRVQQVFTPMQHIQALAALVAAIEVIRPDLQGTDWQDLLTPAVLADIPPPREVAAPLSWVDFLPEGEEPRGYEWPQVPAGESPDMELFIQDSHVQIPDALDELALELGESPWGPFVRTLLAEATEALWLLYEEDPWAITTELTPDWLALERMAKVQLLIHPLQDEDPVQRFWDQVTEQVANRPSAFHTREEWRALAEREGVDLIFAKPALG